MRRNGVAVYNKFVTRIPAIASGTTVLIKNRQVWKSHELLICNSSARVLRRINQPAKIAISIPPIGIIRLAVR